ncbi:MAG: DUF2955 domain-containing protein [Chromatiaceae bacterium]|nr:DUF2955 domain-containing protein [Chromatiaceae bacterium]
MHPADKAALRLAIGLGLAVLVAYGLALPVPFVVCVMAVLVLCKPGPPLPLVKGAILALVFAALVAAGVVMVPLLEHYALAGVLLTAVVLYGVFYAGLIHGNPLTMILVISFALIPVAGVADQALVGMLSLTLAVGILTGTLVSALATAFFPDPPAPAGQRAEPPAVSQETAGWIALRAVLIVMPVFVLALVNPSLYLAAIMKTVALGQQAGETDARSAGRELVGSTLVGALMALAVWIGLSLWPSLWMLMLWLMAAALWAGSAMFGARATAWRPSFWSNALITALILLGPAIEDSASGKSVLQGSAVRASLFLGVALYASAMVWILERWRAARSPAIPMQR